MISDANCSGPVFERFSRNHIDTKLTSFQKDWRVDGLEGRAASSIKSAACL